MCLEQTIHVVYLSHAHVSCTKTNAKIKNKIQRRSRARTRLKNLLASKIEKSIHYVIFLNTMRKMNFKSFTSISHSPLSVSKNSNLVVSGRWTPGVAIHGSAVGIATVLAFDSRRQAVVHTAVDSSRRNDVDGENDDDDVDAPHLSSTAELH